MERKLIAETHIKPNAPEHYLFQYYVFSHKACSGTDVYGILAENYQHENNKEKPCLVDSDSINGISDSYELTVQMIQYLAKNEVSPVTLIEVIDEVFDKFTTQAAGNPWQ